MVEITEYEIILDGVVVARIEWLPTATYSERAAAIETIGDAKKAYDEGLCGRSGY